MQIDGLKQGFNETFIDGGRDTMDRWMITIEAWPHSTDNGNEEDQKRAGDRSKNYVVRAIDAAQALEFAEAIAMGVRSNPMVWRAPITAIVKDREGG